MPEEQLKLDFSGALNWATSSKTKKYFARFVKAGKIKGSNGKPTKITLDPGALQSAAGLFDNKAVFLDHAGFFSNPSLSKLVGTTTGAYYNAQEQSIQGEVRLFETPGGELAEQIIEEVLSNPTDSPDVGLSIVFYPTWNKEHDTILGVQHVESVDLVFQPAADGRILQALSTAFQQSYPQPQQETQTMPETNENPELNHPVLDAWMEATAQAATAKCWPLPISPRLPRTDSPRGNTPNPKNSPQPSNQKEGI